MCYQHFLAQADKYQRAGSLCKDTIKEDKTSPRTGFDTFLDYNENAPN
jgi:hypothetical protein